MPNKPPAWVRWPLIFGLALLFALTAPTAWVLRVIAGWNLSGAERTHKVATWARARMKELTDER